MEPRRGSCPDGGKSVIEFVLTVFISKTGLLPEVLFAHHGEGCRIEAEREPGDTSDEANGLCRRGSASLRGSAAGEGTSSWGIMMTIPARNQKGSMIRTIIKVLVPME